MPEHSQACFDAQTQRCVCPVEDKGARVRAAGPALLAMVLRAEWSGWDHLCLWCKWPQVVGHNKTCELAALLEPLR